MNKSGHGMYISLLSIIVALLSLPYLPVLFVITLPLEALIGEVGEPMAIAIFSGEIVASMIGFLYLWYRGHTVAGPCGFFYSMATLIALMLVNAGY